MSKYKPVPKVRNSGIAGAATVVLVWASYALGFPIPPEVAPSIVMLAMALVGYVTPSE